MINLETVRGCSCPEDQPPIHLYILKELSVVSVPRTGEWSQGAFQRDLNLFRF